MPDDDLAFAMMDELLVINLLSEGLMLSRAFPELSRIFGRPI